MSNENEGGLGGCLVYTLIILVVLAAIGFIDWGTVGKFGKFMFYLTLTSIVMSAIFFIIAYFSGKS